MAGDKLFVSGLLYRLRDPRLGDAVVVKDPRSGRLVLKNIKRINGDTYFVIGENFNKSTDSRQFGTITKNGIIGKVIMRYSSPHKSPTLDSMATSTMARRSLSGLTPLENAVPKRHDFSRSQQLFSIGVDTHNI